MEPLVCFTLEVQKISQRMRNSCCIFLWVATSESESSRSTPDINFILFHLKLDTTVWKYYGISIQRFFFSINHNIIQTIVEMIILRERNFLRPSGFFFRFFELRNTPDPGGNLFLSAGNCDTLRIAGYMILHIPLNLLHFFNLLLQSILYHPNCILI